MSSHSPRHRLRNWLLSKRVRPFLLAVAAFTAIVGLAYPTQAYVPALATSAAPVIDTNAAPARLIQLAQEPNTQQNSTLYFNTPTYVVSVFPRDSTALRMNVYNKVTGQLEQETAPTTFRGATNNTGWVSYESFGSRNSQNVIFRANANRSTFQASLEIIVQATSAIQVQENSTSITAMNVPAVNPPGPSDANTIASFETRTFATRVFLENGIRKMNVFSKLNQQTEVNGQPATLVNPTEAPFQNWVSYFGGQSYRGIPGRFFIRVNGSGEGRLQFIDSTGRAVIEESREGPLLVNIPPSDLPPGVDPPAASASLDPFIAAVFGDEQTLVEVQRVASAARFESSRLGRFINAGSFANRYEAEALVSLLRSRGFNSRLVYRNFSYR